MTSPPSLRLQSHAAPTEYWTLNTEYFPAYRDTLHRVCGFVSTSSSGTSKPQECSR